MVSGHCGQRLEIILWSCSVKTKTLQRGELYKYDVPVYDCITRDSLQLTIKFASLDRDGVPCGVERVPPNIFNAVKHCNVVADRTRLENIVVHWKLTVRDGGQLETRIARLIVRETVGSRLLEQRSKVGERRPDVVSQGKEVGIDVEVCQLDVPVSGERQQVDGAEVTEVSRGRHCRHAVNH